MKITVLVENTTIDENLNAEHGLSLYIESNGKKILFDMGQTEAFASNAKKLGVDLSKIDVAVLSHGHYDHGGGIKKFLEINEKAVVYLSKHSFGEHYNGNSKYIGLDKEIATNKRIVTTEDIFKIADGLTLYSCNDKKLKYLIEPFGLGIKRGNKIYPEDFLHEHYLLIEENGKRILISGCSHKGILNIVSEFKPDVLVGGFHFVKLETEGEDAVKLSAYAKELMDYDTVYFTGHCTGLLQYEFLKEIMGDKISYISTGSVVEI